MIINVNGESKEFQGDAISVLNLLNACKVELPETVSVQVNGIFVDKKDFSSTSLKNGDEVDFLYFMGGGSA